MASRSARAAVIARPGSLVSTRNVSPEVQERLAALGYVATSRANQAGSQPLPDPKDCVESPRVRILNHASQHGVRLGGAGLQPVRMTTPPL